MVLLCLCILARPFINLEQCYLSKSANGVSRNHRRPSHLSLSWASPPPATARGLQGMILAGHVCGHCGAWCG